MRLVASDWEAVQPPDFPMVVKTSQRPSSSSLMVMYRFPQPVVTFSVVPRVRVGRDRGEMEAALGMSGAACSALAGALEPAVST